ncbi:MAG: response regulator [bacterium]|nr:response regulator [bacterium]
MIKTKKVLVIDDDEALRGALEVKFTTKGYAVVTCADGQEGMDALKSDTFDVIVTDLHMPNIDGFALLEGKADTENADIPLYVITNLGSEKYCDKAISLGAKKCFVKSLVTLRDVVETVHEEIA